MLYKSFSASVTIQAPEAVIYKFISIFTKKINRTIDMSIENEIRYIFLHWSISYFSGFYANTEKTYIWRQCCFSTILQKYIWIWKKHKVNDIHFKFNRACCHGLTLILCFLLCPSIKCKRLRANEIKANRARIHIWTYCWPFNK